MASRLMLSLKKATTQKPWSLETMTTISQGKSTEGGTDYSVQQVHRGLHEISQNPAVLNEEDMELNVVP